MPIDNNIASTRNSFCGFNFDNSFARLPHQFYAKVSPTPVTNPTLIAMNEKMTNEFYQTALKDMFGSTQDFELWYICWQERLIAEDSSLAEIANKMLSVNPQYIPRNHRIEQVIDAAVEKSDFSLMHELISVLNNPYSEQEDMQHYAHPPKNNERVHQTFCGT